MSHGKDVGLWKYNMSQFDWAMQSWLAMSHEQPFGIVELGPSSTGLGHGVVSKVTMSLGQNSGIETADLTSHKPCKGLWDC